METGRLGRPGLPEAAEALKKRGKIFRAEQTRKTGNGEGDRGRSPQRLRPTGAENLLGLRVVFLRCSQNAKGGVARLYNAGGREGGPTGGVSNYFRSRRTEDRRGGAIKRNQPVGRVSRAFFGIAILLQVKNRGRQRGALIKEQGRLRESQSQVRRKQRLSIEKFIYRKQRGRGKRIDCLIECGC